MHVISSFTVFTVGNLVGLAQNPGLFERWGKSECPSPNPCEATAGGRGSGRCIIATAVGRENTPPATTRQWIMLGQKWQACPDGRSHDPATQHHCWGPAAAWHGKNPSIYLFSRLIADEPQWKDRPSSAKARSGAWLCRVWWAPFTGVDGQSPHHFLGSEMINVWVRQKC